MTTVNPKMVPRRGLDLSRKSIVRQWFCFCLLEIYTDFYTFRGLAVWQTASSTQSEFVFVTGGMKTTGCPEITVKRWR